MMWNFNNIDEMIKLAAKKQLIIMRGVSGSGKSTTAQSLGGNVYGTDEFFGKTKEEYAKNFNPDLLIEAHAKNADRVEEAMQRQESPIIVDNTNVNDFEMKSYVLLADKYGYDVSFKESTAPHWNLKPGMSEEEKEKLIQVLVEKNQHGVPEEVIRNKINSWDFLDYNDKESVLNRIRNSTAPWEEKQAQVRLAAEKINIPLSNDILKLLEVLQSKGNQALIVGGAVRDAIMGFEPKDIDIEVYGTDYDSLQDFLSTYGKTDLVGKAFGVIKWRDSAGNDYDFSIPRRDSKVTDNTNQRGRGISSEFDINITPKEAASRRDFTMNSLAYNPLTHELLDFFGGVQDINNKILRHTSPAFSEDPLRVLRGMQFSARFDLTLAPETAELAKQLKDSKLVKERLSEEWMKLFTKGKKPSKGIQYLIDTEWIDNYPELKALFETPQHPDHHPEGSAGVHTLMVSDVAAELADEDGLKGDDRAAVIIAAMCHDIGKPLTTITEDGKIKSPGHQSAGVGVANQFLQSIGIKKDIIKRVLPLVEYHMTHLDYKPKSKKTNVRQLSRKLQPSTIQDLERIMKSDSLGRALTDRQLHQMAVQLVEDAKNEGVYTNPLDKILLGRDVLERFPFVQPGKELGEILAKVDMKYLKKEIDSKEEAFVYADKLLMDAFSFVNGNELFEIGYRDSQIRDIKTDIWNKQKNNEINSREEAINYARQKISII